MSYDDIFGEIGAESLADLLPIYYSIERMISNLEKIIECINETEKESNKCTINNVGVCVIKTLDVLEECYNKNMEEFSSTFSTLTVKGAYSLSRWLGGVKRYKSWEEDLIRLVYPMVGMADGIIRFLIANARLITGILYKEESLRKADMETIRVFKPSIDTLLASKGIKVSKNREYFVSGAFRTLLEEAKAHLIEAREILSYIAVEIRKGLDQFIAWRLGKKKP